MKTRNAFERRRILKLGAAALTAPALFWARRAPAAGRVIRIGHVSPRTGPLAAFAEADPFVLDGIRKAIGAGITIGGVVHPVEILSKDSQSSTNRAAEVAAELILSDEVDLLVAASTPDTTNPVADQAEVNEVPCITTDCPWQPYFFGRGGTPAAGFDWTYHFFWGLEDVVASFVAMWQRVPTNRVVGGLFPNDADGNAWGDAQQGLPPALQKAGFTLIDPGRFRPLAKDFTAQISAFKAANAEIVTGNLAPPDFTTFWAQAAQQGYHPKLVTVGKALLFPSVIAGMGARGDGLTTEVWWTPEHPFVSGLTGQSSRELTDAYRAATGRPWTQPMGFKHALFEVAIDALRRTRDIDDPAAIRDAIVATDYASVVGRIHWATEPVRNVCRTPLVGGQWRLTDAGPELVVVENSHAPTIPLGGPLRPLR
ncbi:MAG: ABC transporter substrate-binding protein [Rhodocyclaceae bacterium]|nr:ABC transporter substrate-binding protein [Rhodocyclaceae bacterium]